MAKFVISFILLVIAITSTRYGSCTPQQQQRENITELINEVTPNIFPEYLDTETGTDATYLDVYDGSSGYLVQPSSVVYICVVLIQLVFMFFV